MSDAPAYIALIVSTGGVIVTALNSRAQSRIGRRRLRLDLFDRRLKLWQELSDARDDLSRKITEDCTPDDVLGLLPPLWTAHRAMRFLFDQRCRDAVEDYLDAYTAFAFKGVQFGAAVDDEPGNRKKLRREYVEAKYSYGERELTMMEHIARHLDFSADTVDTEGPEFLKQLHDLRERNIARRQASATLT